VHIGALLDGAHLLLIDAERFRQFLLRQHAHPAHFLQRHFLGDQQSGTRLDLLAARYL